jgi:CHAT domain-containing protein
LTQAADALAQALLVAGAAGGDGARWQPGQVSARELAWAFKRCCDAAWSTDPQATLVAAQWVEQLAREQPDAELDALRAWTRGIALLTQGRMQAALEALEGAGAGFSARGDVHQAAQTQVGRMIALTMLGRHDDAAICGAQARAVFDAAGDARAAGKIELNLGNLAAQRDRYADAARHYDDARSRFAAAQDAEHAVMASKGLADMLARRHELRRALALYEQARDDAERGGFAMLSASIDGDLGALHMLRGRYDAALPCLERSRRGFALLDVPHYLAMAEETLADAYLELNLLPEALALYERALHTYEAAGLSTDRAWALAQRGRALALLGRFDAAAASLEAAQRLFADEHNDVAGALVRVQCAEAALAQRDWRTAAAHARAAQAPLLAARHLSGWLAASGFGAEALAAGGDAIGAQALAQQVAARAQALQLPQPLRRAQLLLGLLARDRGDAAAARGCFEAAVAALESQRGRLPGEQLRSAFLGDKLLPYRELVRSSLADGGPDAARRALAWVERARARSLADLIDADAPNGVADDDHTAQLRRRLNACYRQLARPRDDGGNPAHALDEARQLEAELLARARQEALLAEADGAPRDDGLDLPALLAALGDHSVLIEYFAVDDRLLACVAGDDGVSVHELPIGLAAAGAAIEQLRFQTDTLRHGAARLAHRLPELQQRTLHHLRRLHAALWSPIAPRLGRRRAVVVPHGALHYLPFLALHDGERHEIEHREMCRAPSAGVLLRCLRRDAARFDSALVLGHADARLPHVRAEVERVAARLPGALALLGDAASGAALRAQAAGRDVVHIACHAQFRNDSPRFSALHLADGAFTVGDAQRLPLHGSLLALSACETGISAVLPGDELIGLTHGFISAGAACVLASLWTVQDEAVCDFMASFYERLRASGRPAQALRETQLEAMQTRPHPYFWSAFGLDGRW